MIVSSYCCSWKKGKSVSLFCLSLKVESCRFPRMRIMRTCVPAKIVVGPTYVHNPTGFIGYLCTVEV